MSFKASKRVIEENDTVILYLSINNKHAIDVSREIKNRNGDLVEYVFQTTFGALKVASLIGQEYGSKVCFGSMTFGNHALICNLFNSRSSCPRDGRTSYNRRLNCGV